ncbi:MAG: chromosomal replication initiator protein DnaA [Rickettsiales bacterium]|jgi:chromosomal replication initiator protein|nr:chromosomal replication initiator protein DnaA [Rickettsiales bacterium]
MPINGVVEGSFANNRAGFDIWPSVCEIFRKEFGDDVYCGWMSAINLVSFTEHEIVMSVPTNFIRDWILREYFSGRYKKVEGRRICFKKGIKQILLDFFPDLMSFEFIIDRTRERIVTRTSHTPEQQPATGDDSDKISSFSANRNLYSIGVELSRNYTFANYVVGSSNKLAFEVARNFVDSNGCGNDDNMNPLFLYGGVGLGKTHLIQAMAWDLQLKDPNQQIVYLSAERFMYLFVQALQNQDINNFKNRFRNVDVLIVDDIQFITGKEKTQKEFFYTFDTLLAEGKKIVLACDKAPMNLESLDEKLKSRISGGLIVDIKEFDYQLRFDIIKKKSTDMGLSIGEDIIVFLADKITGNCREIEGCLRRLLVNQKIMGARLDRNGVENILVDNINQSEGVSVENIQGKVAEYFNVSMSDLKSKKRSKNLIVPRHAAMYLSKELTSGSLMDIAKKFGSGSHATVIHGINNIRKLMETNPEISTLVLKLTSLARKVN